MERLFVIKIGGSVIDNEQQLSLFLSNFSTIKDKKILVHGGGKLATRLAEQLNIPQQVVNGRRITNAETLKIITMVYAGYINKNIVAQLQAINCNAIGLSGADGDFVLAHKRIYSGTDYGFVGDVDRINTELLIDLLKKNISVVASPVTHDGKGQLLNTNADTIASSIAIAMSKQFNIRLIYCFEKKGILEEVEDENSVIPLITRETYRQLVNDKKLFDGILPKIENAFTAIDSGVREVLIGDANNLLQNVTAETKGTLIK